MIVMEVISLFISSYIFNKYIVVFYINRIREEIEGKFFFRYLNNNITRSIFGLGMSVSLVWIFYYLATGMKFIVFCSYLY